MHVHLRVCVCVPVYCNESRTHSGIKKMAETNALSPDPVTALPCMEPSVTVFKSVICIH